MKKQTLYLIINAVIMVLIGVIVMVSIKSFVPQDPEDKLFNQMVDLNNQTSIENASGTSYAIVDYRATAVDNSGKAVGTVYNIKIRNSFNLSTSDRGYGYIELLVGLKDGLVTLEIVSLEQSSSYINGIQKYIYEFYDGVPYLSVENIPDYNAATEEDTAAGSTASTSTSSIRSLVWKAIQMHYGLEVEDPLAEYLGEDYVLEVDDAFTATAHVTSKQNLVSSTEVPNGYIYTVTGEGDYVGYDGTATGSITILVIFNSEDEIVSIYVPEESYGHTYGFHTSHNVDYLASYSGVSIDDLTTTINGNADLKTGATYSKTLLDELLGFIVSEVA